MQRDNQIYSVNFLLRHKFIRRYIYRYLFAPRSRIRTHMDTLVLVFTSKNDATVLWVFYEARLAKITMNQLIDKISDTKCAYFKLTFGCYHNHRHLQNNERQNDCRFHFCVLLLLSLLLLSPLPPPVPLEAVAIFPHFLLTALFCFAPSVPCSIAQRVFSVACLSSSNQQFGYLAITGCVLLPLIYIYSSKREKLSRALSYISQDKCVLFVYLSFYKSLAIYSLASAATILYLYIWSTQNAAKNL